MKIRSPRIALDHKIAFASENRRAEGLVAELSVRANIVLAMQAAKGWLRQIPRRQQDELADKYIKALDIRPANPDALVAQPVRRQPAEGAAGPLAASPSRDC